MAETLHRFKTLQKLYRPYRNWGMGLMIENWEDFDNDAKAQPTGNTVRVGGQPKEGEAYDPLLDPFSPESEARDGVPVVNRSGYDPIADGVVVRSAGMIPGVLPDGTEGAKLVRSITTMPDIQAMHHRLDTLARERPETAAICAEMKEALDWDPQEFARLQGVNGALLAIARGSGAEKVLEGDELEAVVRSVFGVPGALSDDDALF